MARDDPAQLTLIDGVRRPHRPKTCAVCGSTVERRWRCQGCWKLICDDCGGENQDGDWFCHPCYDGDE